MAKLKSAIKPRRLGQTYEILRGIQKGDLYIPPGQTLKLAAPDWTEEEVVHFFVKGAIAAVEYPLGRETLPREDEVTDDNGQN